ncbi:MAG: GtrA family protein [Candidatus Coproplasma sp.]
MKEERKEQVTEEIEQSLDKKEKSPKLKQFLQILKFTAFSVSAGVIQFVSTSALFDWTHLLPYWAAFTIGLTLSVIWNFTFNRKFTFAAATNIPISMVLVVIYNCLIVVPLSLGGDKLAELWGDPYGMVVTVIAMLINFVTEFFWDKFIVFNDKVIGKIEGKVKRKKGTTPEGVAEAEPSKQVGTHEEDEEVPTEETVATDTLLLK